jgi:hypothetical protein
LKDVSEPVYQVSVAYDASTQRAKIQTSWCIFWTCPVNFLSQKKPALNFVEFLHFYNKILTKFALIFYWFISSFEPRKWDGILPLFLWDLLITLEGGLVRYISLFSEQFSHVGNTVSLIGGCDRSIRFTRNLVLSCSLILSSLSVRHRLIVFAVTIEHWTKNPKAKNTEIPRVK